jgi:uncharacterized damage-inducible protein DinB
MNTAYLVRYNFAVRELYFDTLAKLPWAEVVKPRGISFDSIRNVFLHLTLVEDRWVNYTLQNRFSLWKDPNFESYQTIASLKEYMTHVKGNTEKFLQNLKTEDWTRKVPNPWINKPDVSITIETALCHMVMENMVHYGELSAVLWQMSLEAPYLAFLRYMYNQETSKTPF